MKLLSRIIPVHSLQYIWTQNCMEFDSKNCNIKTVTTSSHNLRNRKIYLWQKSNRELDRSQRTAQDVLDAASWAVFQKECTDQQLLDLFNQHDARQAFHVTFGQVLSAGDAQGKLLFRDRFMACLDQYEDVHYENIIKHFRRHLDPFKQ